MVSRQTRLSFCVAATALVASVLCAPAFADDGMANAADPNAWPMHGRGYDNTRYSPLKQINTANVNKLKLAYSFRRSGCGVHLGPERGMHQPHCAARRVQRDLGRRTAYTMAGSHRLLRQAAGTARCSRCGAGTPRTANPRPHCQVPGSDRYAARLSGRGVEAATRFAKRGFAPFRFGCRIREGKISPRNAVVNQDWRLKRIGPTRKC